MAKILFTERAFGEYISWQESDRKTIKRINRLLQAISREPYTGIGKPEQLKGDYAGFWSRRIDEKNRLIYKVKDEFIEVYQCKNHYNEK